MLAYLSAALFISMYTHYDNRPYKAWYRRNVQTVHCIAAHLDASPVRCPTGHHLRLTDLLAKADRENRSFLRKIRNGTRAALQH